MTLEEFCNRCPFLVHYAPQFDLVAGLLTAAQVLDRNADEQGNVWARFRSETTFQSYSIEYWKANSRFHRKAGESGCCLVVRDVRDFSRMHILGNNYPLGDGTCLGTTIPLSDNRPGDTTPTREQWFRILNDMFWVFPDNCVNTGFVARLRVATPGKVLYCVRLATRLMPDYELKSRIRLSKINGGGSNGCRARGTATY